MKAQEPPRKQPGHRLRVFIDEKSGEVHVEGNTAGLEYLAAVCVSVIGQPPGPSHWHLSEVFNTLEEASPDLMISYRAELES